MPRKAFDWEAIEREYRAGQLSVIEIARQFGLSHTAIQKRAKRDGWTRNLAAMVRRQVSTRLVSEVSPEVAETNARLAIEVATTRGVQVVREHRGDIGRLRRIGAILADRLEKYVAGEETNGVCVGEKESVSDMLEKLSRVSTRVVQLERQAFNLDAPADEMPESQSESARERISSRILGLAARGGPASDPVKPD